jgi:hypothetical protein
MENVNTIYQHEAFRRPIRRTPEERAALKRASHAAWLKIPENKELKYRGTREREKWKLENDPKYREILNKRAYDRLGKSLGFTPQLFEFLWEKQTGQCAICSVKLTRVGRTRTGSSRDHCHVTGQPRGLLCHCCNTCLGQYEKHQKNSGLVIEPYERYLKSPPAMSAPEELRRVVGRKMCGVCGNPLAKSRLDLGVCKKCSFPVCACGKKFRIRTGKHCQELKMCRACTSAARLKNCLRCGSKLGKAKKSKASTFTGLCAKCVRVDPVVSRKTGDTLKARGVAEANRAPERRARVSEGVRRWWKTRREVNA